MAVKRIHPYDEYLLIESQFSRIKLTPRGFEIDGVAYYTTTEVEPSAAAREHFKEYLCPKQP